MIKIVAPEYWKAIYDTAMATWEILGSTDQSWLDKLVDTEDKGTRDLLDRNRHSYRFISSFMTEEDAIEVCDSHNAKVKPYKFS